MIEAKYFLLNSMFAFQLDGFIARNWTSQASKLGSFLDPMADKLLVGSLVISLSWCNLFPIWLSGMIIFRDVFLIIAGFVIRYISLPQPVRSITNKYSFLSTYFAYVCAKYFQRTLTRYFNATYVTAKLQPTFISKVNTAVQLATIAASLAAPVYGVLGNFFFIFGEPDADTQRVDVTFLYSFAILFSDHPALVGMWYFTGFTTAAAATSYLLSKDTYKLIKNGNKLQK